MEIHNNGAYCKEDNHAVKYAIANKAKAQKKLKAAERKENRKAVKRLRSNDRKYQFQKTKQEAQTLANLLDKDLPCICCDEPRGNAQFCGGHYKTAKGHPEIALDIRNIHGQRNSLCNKHKSGNIEGDKHSKGFKQGVIDRYGQEYLDWLESYHPPPNYSCEDLIKLRAEYAAEKRYIKEHGKPSKNWRELPTECETPENSVIC